MPYVIRRFRLDTLPFVSTNTKTGTVAFPDFPVVYIIFNDEEVFYVGATKSLFNRWSGLKSDWRINRVLKRKGVKIGWFSAPVERLSDIEVAVIQFLNPKLNLMRRGKTYHFNGVGNNQKKHLRYERLISPKQSTTNGNGR